MQVCFLTGYFSGQCINFKNPCFKGMEFSDIVEGEEGTEIIYRVVFFNWASPEFAKCWPVNN